MPPVLQPVSPKKNMFTDKQESDLGDIIAESAANEIQEIGDEELTAHFRQVADRLVRYLPANHFRFRFALVEMAEVNAFSLPGGRIYIGRKMVAFTQNDDELAGVLAHELGHVVTHQAAIGMTARFRDALGVNEVGDRPDIEAKFHRMLETWRLKPYRAGFKEEEEHQYAADQVALFAMARAGYAPQAYVDLLDRLQQTHGKTGSWFTDIFSVPKPEQRRLRELLKAVSSLPSGCVETSLGPDAPEFERWQAEVIDYRSNGQESLPGLILNQRLALPLRPDISNIHFSPDGKYILAQDEGAIHVLSRDPFAALFVIETPDVRDVRFTPDSKGIVVYTDSLRVEMWDLASHKRTSVHEVLVRGVCLQTAISPDGKFVGCLNSAYNLSLYDVMSGNSLINRNDFFQPTFDEFVALFTEVTGGLRSRQTQLAQLINMDFSPDGKYFLAGCHANSLVFDVSQKREASDVSGAIRGLIRGRFAFLGGDRIASVNLARPEKSPILRFPSGEHIAELPLSVGSHLSSPGHGDYVLVWPLRERDLGVMDLNKRAMTVAFPQKAGDIYDNYLVFEQKDGELTLADSTTRKTLSRLQIAEARLGSATNISASDDLSHLAVSTSTRGAVWDVASGIRTQYVRGFRGGWFDADQTFYADFPKKGEQDRALVRLDRYGGVVPLYTMGEALSLRESGVVSETCAKESYFSRKNCTLELRDLDNKTAIWSRHFPNEAPMVSWNLKAGTVLLWWPLSQSAGRKELDQFSDLKTKANSEDYLFELCDLRRNSVVGKLIVKTNRGSFNIDSAEVTGDWVILSVRSGRFTRVMTYSLSSGEERGHVFGRDAVVTAATEQYAVTLGQRHVAVYDAGTSSLQHEFEFANPVAFKKFSADGKRILVLTRNQSVYILDLTNPAGSEH